MNIVIRVGVLLFLGLNAVCVSAETAEEELNRYIGIFEKGDVKAQTEACKWLRWTTLSDARLFDIMESGLRDMSEGKTKDTKMAACYARSLGASTNPKYSPFLESLAQSSNKKLARFAQQGLEYFGQHKEWNPVILNKSGFRSDKPHKTNRLANMLRSGDWELKIAGADIIYIEKLQDDYLLDILNKEVLGTYKDIGGKRQLYGQKVLVKSLGSFNLEAYLPTLQEVEKNGGDEGLRKYASKTIKRFYGK